MARHVKRQRRRPEYVQRILDANVLPRWANRDARTIKPREVIEPIPDERAKAGKGHVLPLANWAIEELQKLKVMADGSRYVLPNADGSAPIDDLSGSDRWRQSMAAA
jgi:hypothetical protein